MDLGKRVEEINVDDSETLLQFSDMKKISISQELKGILIAIQMDTPSIVFTEQLFLEYVTALEKTKAYPRSYEAFKTFFTRLSTQYPEDDFFEFYVQGFKPNTWVSSLNFEEISFENKGDLCSWMKMIFGGTIPMSVRTALKKIPAGSFYIWVEVSFGVSLTDKNIKEIEIVFLLDYQHHESEYELDITWTFPTDRDGYDFLINISDEKTALRDTLDQYAPVKEFTKQHVDHALADTDIPEKISDKNLYYMIKSFQDLDTTAEEKEIIVQKIKSTPGWRDLMISYAAEHTLGRLHYMLTHNVDESFDLYIGGKEVTKEFSFPDDKNIFTELIRSFENICGESYGLKKMKKYLGNFFFGFNGYVQDATTIKLYADCRTKQKEIHIKEFTLSAEQLLQVVELFCPKDVALDNLFDRNTPPKSSSYTADDEEYDDDEEEYY